MPGQSTKPATVKIQGSDASVTADGHFLGAVQTTAGTTTFTIQSTDASGNASLQRYQFEAAGPSRTLAYDANGNRTSDDARTFEWDARNQIVAVTIGTHRSEFTYDGQQRRVRVVEKENVRRTRGRAEPVPLRV